MLIRSRDERSPPVGVGTIGAVLLAAAMVVLVAAAPSAARAAGGCHGTYTASSLAALPSPLVVGADSLPADGNRGALAAAFVAAMQGVGLNFSGTPNVQLDLAGNMVAPLSNAPAQSYVFDWGADPSPGAPPILGSTFDLSVSLMDVASSSIAWTGTISCTVATNDRIALARDMGALVGATIGKSFADRKF